MAITASMVKELRSRTGAGMMECKNALKEADGDLDGAIEALRRKGVAKADKKAGRVAAEGVVLAALSDDRATGVLVEINCETDFVAKDAAFKAFADGVARTVLAEQPADVEALAGLALAGDAQTIEAARVELVNKIGEKVSLRRFQVLQAAPEGRIDAYTHGARIGVLVSLSGGRADLGRDLAMHIAASQPRYLSADEVPAELLDAEREIYAAQARESGKPDNIVEKMVQGRLKKFTSEISLLGQPYVKDTDQTVAQLLESEQAQVLAFQRLEVGEGLEKREDDFVSDVMAQARGE